MGRKVPLLKLPSKNDSVGFLGTKSSQRNSFVKTSSFTQMLLQGKDSSKNDSYSCFNKTDRELANEKMTQMARLNGEISIFPFITYLKKAAVPANSQEKSMDLPDFKASESFEEEQASEQPIRLLEDILAKLITCYPQAELRLLAVDHFLLFNSAKTNCEPNYSSEVNTCLKANIKYLYKESRYYGGVYSNRVEMLYSNRSNLNLSVQANKDSIISVLRAQVKSIEQSLLNENFNRRFFREDEEEETMFLLGGVFLKKSILSKEEGFLKELYFPVISHLKSSMLNSLAFDEISSIERLTEDLNFLSKLLCQLESVSLAFQCQLLLGEIFLVVKKNLVNLLEKYFISDEAELIKVNEISVPLSLLKLTANYANCAAMLLNRSALPISDKFFNEILVKSSKLNHVLKNVLYYVLKKENLTTFQEKKVSFKVLTTLRKSDLEVFENVLVGICNYFTSIVVFLNRISIEENLNFTEVKHNSTHKYWLNSVKNISSFINFLINTVDGVLFEHLSTKPTFKNNAPKDKNLIKAANLLLSQCYRNSYFTKHIVTEEFCKVMVSLHYRNFIQLYSFENQKYTEKLEKVLFQEMESYCLDEVKLSQMKEEEHFIRYCVEGSIMQLENLFYLIKASKDCLVSSIEKLGILDFLVNEVSLEFECEETVLNYKRKLNHKRHRDNMSMNFKSGLDSEPKRAAIKPSKSINFERRTSLESEGSKEIKEKIDKINNQTENGKKNEFSFDEDLSEMSDIPLCIVPEGQKKAAIPRISILNEGFQGPEQDTTPQNKNALDLTLGKTPEKKDLTVTEIGENSDSLDDIPLCDPTKVKRSSVIPKLTIMSQKISDPETVHKDFENAKEEANQEDSDSLDDIPLCDPVQMRKPSVIPQLTIVNQVISDPETVHKDFETIQNESAIPSQEDSDSLDDIPLCDPIQIRKSAIIPKLTILNEKISDPETVHKDFEEPSKKPVEDCFIDDDVNFSCEAGTESSFIDRMKDSDHNGKLQLFLDKLKEKYRLVYHRLSLEKVNQADMLEVDSLYTKEKKSKLIYLSKELHSSVIAVILSILVDTKGSLNPAFCCSNPYELNKTNYLFLLNQHIKHHLNETMLPNLLEKINSLDTEGGALRLLKLLSPSFFNKHNYGDLTKIESGAYGTVYSAKTGIDVPSEVAIKKIPNCSKIFNTCTLFDAFTEISIMEMFDRMNCCPALLDFGCDEEYIYIVMEKFDCSLKKWRLEEERDLSTCLELYSTVLETAKILHSNGAIHYDIKADNVLLKRTNGGFQVRLTDFGESKIVKKGETEFDTRNRGTDLIKSPEMLNLGGISLEKFKGEEDYDRRKKVGTSKASDIWSLGCLLFELVTGSFLFEDDIMDDITCLIIMKKVNTMPFSEYFTAKHREMLENNVYLIDFLAFVLVTEQASRPSIETVQSRFNHVKAILASETAGVQSFAAENYVPLSDRVELLEKMSFVEGGAPRKDNETKLNRIFKDVFYATTLDTDTFSKAQITHIVSFEKLEVEPDFLTLRLSSNKIGECLIPTIDFLRHAMLFRGSVCFLESNEKDNRLKQLLVLVMSVLLEVDCFEVYKMLNKQCLTFSLSMRSLISIVKFGQAARSIRETYSNYLLFKCLCGSCSIIMKPGAVLQRSLRCKCAKESSQCPSTGCKQYVNDVKNNYGISYEFLNWIEIRENDVFLGLPGEYELSEGEQQILSLSKGIDYNSCKAAVFRKNLRDVITERTNEWTLFKCKVCQMWLFSQSEDSTMLLANNKYSVHKKQKIKQEHITKKGLDGFKLSLLL